MISPFGRLTMIILIPMSVVLLSSNPSAQPLMSNQDLLPVRHVSVSIARPPDVVYQFTMQPENLPKWAVGLGTSFRKQGDGSWIAEGGPVGRATVRFVERNRLGVLDHDVTVGTGETIHNPIRVIPNGDGSEVVFTLFRQTGVTAARFNEDAEAVEKDLRTLKRLLESRPG
jgi:hypothetical protein